MVFNFRLTQTLSVALVASAVCSYAQTNDAAGSNSSSKPAIPAALTPPCTPLPTYHTPHNPDKIDIAIKARKRYRLVIGAGEFIQSPGTNTPNPNNRSFVTPTAIAVDKALADAGFSALPGLPQDSPYLVGKAATKQAIKDALKTMQQIMSPNDFGVVYYVGHGMIAPSNKDLSLAVYDRPVAPDDGIRVSDLLGELEVSSTRLNIKEIPQFLIVLDACFSGNAALGSTAELVTTKNVQRIQAVENQIVPDQIAIMSATSDGDNSSAYELTGTGESAFGFYFARALQEDWPCADVLPDGILTLSELKNYLYLRLRAAGMGIAGQKYTEGTMVPTILNKDDNAFIAYSASHYSVEGLRELIVDIEIQPASDQVAEVTLPTGNQLICAGANANGLVKESTCAAVVSRKSLGDISVVSRSADDYKLALAVAAQAQQAAIQAEAAQRQVLQAKTHALHAEEAIYRTLRLDANEPDYSMSVDRKMGKDLEVEMAHKEAARTQLAEAQAAEAQAAQVQAQAQVAQGQAAQAQAKWAQHDRISRKQGSVSFADLVSQKQKTVVGVTLKIQ
jgi:hypothetical protein